MKTSSVVKVVEDLETERDRFKTLSEQLETENAKLKYQLQIKSLSSSESLMETYSAIVSDSKNTSDMQTMHDQQCE